MDRYQYLLVLAACLAITAPLEFLGRGVYRQPRRTITAIAPVAALFVIWDALAIVGDVWTYNPRYMTGWTAFGIIPVEELLFFVVIPLCGLLTFSAVDTILDWARRRSVSARSDR